MQPRICIASRRTAPSTLLRGSGPSRCTWCTSRPDLDAAPGRPSLFSCPPSLGIGRDELKRPENSLRTIPTWDRSGTRDRGATCVCTGCIRIIVGFFVEDRFRLVLGGIDPPPPPVISGAREEFRSNYWTKLFYYVAYLKPLYFLDEKDKFSKKCINMQFFTNYTKVKSETNVL